MDIATQLRSRGGAIRQLDDNDRAQMGTLSFRALHGGNPAAGTNEGSLGLKLFNPGPGILIPGDFGITTEDSLLSRRKIGKVDLLIAGHHGSRHSSGHRWLAALEPRQIAVSCGRANRFRHPHAEFLDRAQRIETVLLRTDQCGTLNYALSQPSNDGCRRRWQPIALAQDVREGCDEGQRHERHDEHCDGGPSEAAATRR